MAQSFQYKCTLDLHDEFEAFQLCTLHYQKPFMNSPPEKKENHTR